MKSLFRLLRLPNLIIIALTQGLLYYRIILPALSKQGILPGMSEQAFWILSAITINIAAAGYLINDYHDQLSDSVNRPERVIVGTHISEQVALWLYAAFSISGFLAALFIAMYLDKTKLLFLYPLAYAMLYGYTYFAQKRVLLGNLVIAVFCAGVAAVIWLAEQSSLMLLKTEAPDVYARALAVLIWYAVFAFLINLYREIIKDMEDWRGDKAAGNRTLPIVFGEKNASRVATGVGLVLLLFLIVQAGPLLRLFGAQLVTFLGIAAGLPLILSFYWLNKSAQAHEYRRISLLIKMIILAGVLSLALVRI